MRALLGILIAVIIIGGVWFFLRPAPTVAPSQPTPQTPTSTEPAPATPEPLINGGGATLNVKTPAVPALTATVNLSGKNFAFSQKEIRVKQGSRVNLTFTSSDGFHDFVVDGLNVRTKKLNTGATDTIEFTADKAGTFEYYCSVGEHRKMGMVGKLIVE